MSVFECALGFEYIWLHIPIVGSAAQLHLSQVIQFVHGLEIPGSCFLVKPVAQGLMLQGASNGANFYSPLPTCISTGAPAVKAGSVTWRYSGLYAPDLW